MVGWELKASGLCRADRCTPAPALADAGDAVDIGEVAAALGRAVVLEPGAAIAAVALDAEARRRALDGLEAPEFELPDLNGSPHALSGVARHQAAAGHVLELVRVPLRPAGLAGGP